MDETAFTQLYRDHLAPLYEYISRRVGGDRALAEDTTQEAWLRAVVDWGHSGRPREPLAWLKTVSRRLLANHFRRRRPLPLTAVTLTEDDRSLSGRPPEAVALIHWGLGKLRPEQGQLLEAFHLDGRSMTDIAREAGITERAVEGRLARARESLRRHLGTLPETSRPGPNPAGNGVSP